MSRRFRRSPGIHLRISFAAALVGIAVAPVAALLVRSSAESTIRIEVARRNEQAAGRLAGLFDDRLASLAEALRVLASSERVAAMDASAGVDLGAALEATQSFDSLTLYDSRGKAVAGRAALSVVDIADLPLRPDLIRVVRASDRFFSIERGARPLLSVAVPVESPPGHVAGALDASVPLAEATNRIEAFRIGSSGLAILVDQDGRVLAHPDRSRVVERSTIPVDRLRQALGGAGRGSRDGPGGKATILAAAGLEEIQGFVVVEQEEDEAFAPIDGTLRRLTLIITLLVLVTIAAVIAVARSALKPLGPVADAVSRFGAGDRAARAPVGGSDEIGLLATQFNAMAESLEDRMGELARSNAALRETKIQLERQLGEIRRGEAELRASEARFQEGVANAPIGMAMVSTHGRFLSVNAELRRMLGRDERDLVQSSFASTIFHSDLAGWVEALKRMVSGEIGSETTEVRYLHPSGDIVWALTAATLVRDREGKPASIFLQIMDISERKRIERALQQSERMYAEAYEREREATNRLRALDGMKNTFLTAVSHELRTPLTSIVGFAETLSRDGGTFDPEDSKLLLERMVVNSRKLERMLADLLDLDRLSRGIIEPRRRPTDVGALIRRIAETPEACPERDLRVEPSSAVGTVDAAMVERIVENLLANAARHTPPGTAVWVRAARVKGAVEIVVEDAGPGIPEANRAGIFDPFDRGPERSGHVPGTGIGLSLVARFAELHGGSATAGEREGGGASFRVVLPDDAAAGEGSPEAAASG